jgi:hypothetical protein
MFEEAWTRRRSNRIPSWPTAISVGVLSLVGRVASDEEVDAQARRFNDYSAAPPQGAFELGVELAANAVTCSSPNCLKSVEGSHPEDVA